MRKKKHKPKRTPPLPDRLVYSMKLYVTGATPRSTRAITNLKRLCEEHLTGRYELEVIDVYQQPGLARAGQIIAAPTLVKSLPLPLRKFIGDMSNEENLLAGLNIQPDAGLPAGH
jgi:circadian clock protein KaiB